MKEKLNSEHGLYHHCVLHGRYRSIKMTLICIEYQW